MEHIRDILPQRKSLKTVSEELLIEYKCPACKDNGVLYPIENGKVCFDRVITCKCSIESLKKEQQELYLRLCKLPFDTERMTFKSFLTKGNASLVEARDYAKVLAEGNEELRWLTLISKVDRGKTHLAVAICRRWLGRGMAARYTFVPLLLKELKDGFELEGEQSYRLKLDYFCNVGLLVLDDLGVEKASEWAQEQIQTIVHYRGINGLPLVVTSNKPLNDMPIDPEHRIASRLQRESWCRVVAIDVGEHRFWRVK